MLTLPIKKKWFDMIISGVKKEEYRSVTPYYLSRLLRSKTDKATRKNVTKTLSEYSHSDALFENITQDLIKPEVIRLVNGYGNKRPFIDVECVAISIKKGKQDWGAEENKKYLTFVLGEITNKGNF